jgi:adenosylcobinamide-GDP ribazoletransferase
VLDGFRLALGTFTIAPIQPPKHIDSATVRAALLWAPIVGIALGACAGGLALATYVSGHRTALAALLGAALGIAALAVLTRGLHLDGLADTADGLGSGRTAEGALTIMKQSDVGPFGVVTLVLTLLVQIAALASATASGRGWIAAIVSVAAGRVVLAWGCCRAIVPARGDGLGATWARALPNWAPIVLTAAVALAAAALGLATAASEVSTQVAWRCAVAVLLATLAASLLLIRCVTRFGGVTGDVLGSMVESATTVALLVFAFGS